MNMRSATLIAAIGAGISVAYYVLLAVDLQFYLLNRSTLQYILIAPPLTYLNFFVALFLRQAAAKS